MSYTVNQIKVMAYNHDAQKDFTPEERNLFTGLEYCYEWFRSHPDDQEECESLGKLYIEFFEKCSLRELPQKGGRTDK